MVVFTKCTANTKNPPPDGRVTLTSAHYTRQNPASACSGIENPGLHLFGHQSPLRPPFKWQAHLEKYPCLCHAGAHKSPDFVRRGTQPTHPGAIYATTNGRRLSRINHQSRDLRFDDGAGAGELLGGAKGREIWRRNRAVSAHDEDRHTEDGEIGAKDLLHGGKERNRNWLRASEERDA